MSESTHFKGKDAVAHVAEAHARGIIASSEVHGTEIPGSISAGTDSARETALVLLLIFLFGSGYGLLPSSILFCFLIFLPGWLVWKVGRSGWLGWSRLERLHRILDEEKWEIEHNRTQEREELKALYAAKGFEGKLLEDVLDVLMADGDRLLKVMIEEELGLSLEVHEHPLKQSLGAGLGVVISAALCLAGFILFFSFGLLGAALATMIGSSWMAARYEGNQLIPAVVWNVAILLLSLAASLFLFQYLIQAGWMP